MQIIYDIETKYLRNEYLYYFVCQLFMQYTDIGTYGWLRIVCGCNLLPYTGSKHEDIAVVWTIKYKFSH